MKDLLLSHFRDLGLNPLILKALEAKGYSDPTPIQQQAIPGVMAGRDLLGIAQTGTGKTAAFALPILHRLAAARRSAPRLGCRCLVLSPTRELATQIAESFKEYGSELRFSVVTVFGGVAHGPQKKALERGVDVLVAAPGRLLDHLGERTANLSGLEILVLDEADQMLDMGFIAPIRRILQHLPKQRQNLFFSATMPADIGRLAVEMLKDPVNVSVAPQATTAERVNQQVVFVEAARKKGLLVELFQRPDFRRVLVFTRTKRGADKVARILEGAGVSALAIHGNKSQNQRERALSAFKAGEVRALVATDIAARGIDISSVTHVVQFELPNVPESYVHRIGRTARAGADGSAVAFCAEDERSLLRDIEKVTRQRIPSVDRRGDEGLGRLTAASPEAVPAGNDYEGSGQSGKRNGGRGARPESRSGGKGGRREGAGPSRGNWSAGSRSKGPNTQKASSDGRKSAQGPGRSGKAAPPSSSKPAVSAGRPDPGASAGGGGRPKMAGPNRRSGSSPSRGATPASNVMEFLQASNPWSE